MEQNAPDSMFGLTLSYSSGNNLKDGARWANFIAILFIIILGLAILIFAVVAVFLARDFSAIGGNDAALAAGMGSIMIILVVLFMVANLFGAIQLLRFAVRTKQAIDTQNQQLFNNSLKSLKTYFLITGILSILSLLYSILTVMLAVFGFPTSSNLL